MSKIIESICTNCGAKLDAVSATDGSDYAPEPGSLSICAYCGTIAIFEDNMSLRPMTSKEIDELSNDVQSEIIRISNLIKRKRMSMN